MSQVEAYGTGTARWGKARSWWLQTPGMDADRWCVMTALATYADEEGVCHPSQATLARWLKRSRPWVNRVIGQLAEDGLIRKTARTRTNNAGTTSCEYRLAIHPSEIGPRSDAGSVTDTTSACHDRDAPSHGGDTTQTVTKLNKVPLPDARDPEPETATEVPLTMRAEGCGVPADWRPSEYARAHARALAPDIDCQAHAAMFAAKSRAKGYLYRQGCLDDAWLSWLAEDKLKGGRHNSPGIGPACCKSGRSTEPGERRFSAWGTAAAAPTERRAASPNKREQDGNPWN